MSARHLIMYSYKNKISYFQSCRQVGLDLQNIPEDATVVDAEGQLVMPGAIKSVAK